MGGGELGLWAHTAHNPIHTCDARVCVHVCVCVHMCMGECVCVCWGRAVVRCAVACLCGVGWVDWYVFSIKQIITRMALPLPSPGLVIGFRGGH